MHFLFFPAYIRSYSENVFHIKPHYVPMIIVYILTVLQIIIILIQQIDKPMRFLPRGMRRNIRKVIRE